MQDHPDVAGDAFYLRKSGNRILEIVGKRPVHAVALGVGRFNILPTADELDEIGRIATEVKETAARLIGRLDRQDQRTVHFSFPVGHSVNFLSYDGRTGQERFRAYSRAGNLVAEFDRRTFGDHVSEMRVDWSVAKFPYLTELGFPDGILRGAAFPALSRGGRSG